MSQCYQGCLPVDGRADILRLYMDIILSGDQFEFVSLSQPIDDPLENIKVRWEIECVADDFWTPDSGAQGSTTQLEKVDRGRIGHQHLAGSRADQLCDFVTQRARGVDPVFVPAADQSITPLVLFRVFSIAVPTC